MDISFNIKDILEKHDLAILPGLGVFYKKRQDGFFDENLLVFHPPKEIIQFSTVTPEEVENPVIDYICHTRKVSPASADYLLNQFITQLKDILAQQKELPLNGLGKLVAHDGDLVFEEEKALETNLSYFGLPIVNIKPDAIVESKVILEDLEEEKVEEQTSFSLAEQALNASLSGSTEVKEKKKPKKWLFILIPVMLALISVFALYFFNPDLYNQYFNPNLNNQDVKVVVPVGVTQEQQDSSLADSVYNEIEKNAKAQGLEIEKVKDSTNVTISNKAVPNKSGIRYEIIIAAWQTRAKAEDEVKRLKANGINAFIVEDADGPMIKISAATFYNKAEADVELKRIREELNPEAFIKPIKPLK
jgi:cell division septation protein DedD